MKQELSNRERDLFYKAIKRKDNNKEFIEFLIKNGAHFEKTYDTVKMKQRLIFNFVNIFFLSQYKSNLIKSIIS